MSTVVIVGILIVIMILLRILVPSWDYETKLMSNFLTISILIIIFVVLVIKVILPWISNL